MTSALLFSVLLMGGWCHAQTLRVSSPDGQVALQFASNVEGIFCSAAYQGKPVLLDSRLGLIPYRPPYDIRKQSTEKRDSQWILSGSGERTIPDRYNQLTVDLREKTEPKMPLRLTFRAYDEGIAFRYTVLGAGEFTVPSEETAFRFPEGALTLDGSGAGGDVRKISLLDLASKRELPIMVECGQGTFVSLTEAAYTENWRILLVPDKAAGGTLVSALKAPVRASAPFSSPWRVLIVGNHPAHLLERSYLVWNLNSRKPPSDQTDSGSRR